jgi:tRNA nucleotidyltransferase (CCA-adding enzyme)
MKSNQIHYIIQKALNNLFVTYPTLSAILDEIDKQKGEAYLVGGMVRDMLLNRPTKDLDIEVHGLQENQFVTLLKRFGYVDYVGKSFGVFKLQGIDIDWSLPRTDSAGRKPTVVIDPYMSIKDAFRRRDLTINAMGINMRTGELVDPFGGQDDLAKGLLRSPDVTLFQQDPLRFFRVMQFISRFDMKPDEQLESVCKSMDLKEVSRDRIEQEFSKMLLKSQVPSLGIRWLKSINRISELLPELAATIGVVQDYRWHPEGDVFEHSMQSLDAAVALDYENDQEKLTLLYAALCHDLGKVTTTFEDEKGIHSYGHAEVGCKIAQKMLKRITHNKLLIDMVSKLVRWHMVPMQLLKGGAKMPAFKRLATNLAPQVNGEMLAKLVMADHRGRNKLSHKPLTDQIPEVQQFIEKMEQAGVKHAKEVPLLTGKDFLDVIKPGPLMGRLVKKAYELQLEGTYNKDELKKRILKGVKK